MTSSLNHDDVTNPAHYDLFPGQQAIDVIQAALTPEEFRGYLKGNALKYRLRAGEKGDPAKCLAKANWYRDRLWQEQQRNQVEWPACDRRIDLIREIAQ